MNKLKFNSDNAKYYSEEFIKGFECGVERQFNADMAEKTAEWIVKADNEGTYGICSNCGMKQYVGLLNYCSDCGYKMKNRKEKV